MQIELPELVLVAMRLILAVVDQGEIDTARNHPCQGQATQITFLNYRAEEREKLRFSLRVEGELMNCAPIVGAIHFTRTTENEPWRDCEVTAYLKLGSIRYQATLTRDSGRSQVRVSHDRYFGGKGADISIMELQQLPSIEY